MPRRLDGAREPSEYDAAVSALCVSDAAHSASLPPPRLEQTTASSVVVRAHRDADALYVTDEDGTLLAFTRTLTRDATSSHATLSLGEHTPYAIAAHAHHPPCAATASPAVRSWEAQLMEFNYEARGGVTNHSAFTEAELRASAPALSAGEGLTATLRMLQQPRLFVPLLYAKCAASSVLTLRAFTADAWPTARPAEYTASFSVPLRGCPSLRACASIPVDAPSGCGGHPERCVEVDWTPHLVAAIEAAATPTWLAANASYAPSGTRLLVSTAPLRCAVPLLRYVKDAEHRPLAYGDGKLHLQPPHAPALLAAYSYCEEPRALLAQRLYVSPAVPPAAQLHPTATTATPAAQLHPTTTATPLAAQLHPTPSTATPLAAQLHPTPSTATPLAVDLHPTPSTAAAAPFAAEPRRPSKGGGACISPLSGELMGRGPVFLWSGARCDCIDGRLACGEPPLAHVRGWVADAGPAGVALLSLATFGLTLLLLLLALRTAFGRRVCSLKEEFAPLRTREGLSPPASSPPPSPPPRDEGV